MRTTERTQALPCTQTKLMLYAFKETWTWYDIQVTSFGRFFYLISVSIVIWCWQRITHHVMQLEAHTLYKLTNKLRKLQWHAQSMDLNPSKHAWDIEAQCACTASLYNQLSVSSRVLLIRCAILQEFLHRYIISCGTMYIAVIATAGGHTMYWNEVYKCILLIQMYWYCSVLGCPC